MRTARSIASSDIAGAVEVNSASLPPVAERMLPASN
jgi:hypothetical protein